MVTVCFAMGYAVLKARKAGKPPLAAVSPSRLGGTSATLHSAAPFARPGNTLHGPCASTAAATLSKNASENRAAVSCTLSGNLPLLRPQGRATEHAPMMGVKVAYRSSCAASRRRRSTYPQGVLVGRVTRGDEGWKAGADGTSLRGRAPHGASGRLSSRDAPACQPTCLQSLDRIGRQVSDHLLSGQVTSIGVVLPICEPLQVAGHLRGDVEVVRFGGLPQRRRRHGNHLGTQPAERALHIGHKLGNFRIQQPDVDEGVEVRGGYFQPPQRNVARVEELAVRDGRQLHGDLLGAMRAGGILGARLDHGPQQLQGVPYAAGAGADGVELGGELAQAVPADDAVGGTVADAAVVGRGHAHGAASVSAERHAEDAAPHRVGGPAGGAPGRPVGGVGVDGGAGGGAHAELVQHSLPDDDGAAALEQLDGPRGVRGAVSCEERRACRG
ncbi:uncharacterized protein BcabD6B2_06680 [Babesia caballi]|uniref:Uncharacterized protein n=1 Tax=Babesia caballi TaxID=5871 RepID=A0AAV4LNC0_BABCB|nr:hypothetical protein BcabD6B2_06680 [Babesia caballi]